MNSNQLAPYRCLPAPALVAGVTGIPFQIGELFNFGWFSELLWLSTALASLLWQPGTREQATR